VQQEVEDRAVESAANHNFGHIVTTLQDSGSTLASARRTVEIHKKKKCTWYAHLLRSRIRPR